MTILKDYFLKSVFISTLLLLVLTACSSGGGGLVIGPSDLATVAVSESGSVQFTGTGDFTGLVLSARDIKSAAGGTLQIKKTSAPSSISEYIPVGYIYKFAVYDRSGNQVLNPTGSIILTVPYNSAVVQRAAVSPDAIVLLRDGMPFTGTVSTEKSTITVALSGMSVFVAAFKEDIPELHEHPLPFIEFAWEGYKNAPKIIDKSGSAIADTVRGIGIVQIGERVILSGREGDITGYGYKGYQWLIIDKPTGSTAALSSSSGRKVVLIPDKFGRYVIRLTASKEYGGTDTGNVTVTAGNYSLGNTSSGPSNFCVFCHNGGALANFGHIKDIYGRPKLRDLTTPWRSSVHGNAFTNLPQADRNNTVCLNCHTTGFLFADRNGSGNDNYPNAYGFDDLIADWKNPSAGTANGHLKAVSCESCHGPGGAGASLPNTDFQHDYKANIAQGVCMTCHDLTEGVGGGHFAEWGDQHVNSHRKTNGNVSKTEPCFQCHVGQAFIGRMSGKTLAITDVKSPDGVTCSVCHDPHNEKGNPYQLRTIGSAVLKINGSPVTVNAGKSAVCYNCHNAYVTLPSVGNDLHGNESEMLEGLGGYAYGMDITVLTHGGRVVTDKCVQCHMRASGGTTHKRRLVNDGVYNTAGCSTANCHQGAYALPTSGNRFDYKGRLTEIQGLMGQLQAKINGILGRHPSSLIGYNYSSELAGDKLLAVNRAAYNYLFVYRDGSSGAHNYSYAKRLLELSLNDLARYQ